MIKDEQADEPIKQFVRAQTDIEIDRYSDTGANSELYFGKRKVESAPRSGIFKID